MGTGCGCHSERRQTIVRLADPNDLAFLDRYDPLLRRAVLEEKIARGQIYIATKDDERVGLARHEFLCDLDPFLTLIYVLESYRRQGVAKELMEYWERQMMTEGHRFLLTSTQADEDAQFFYRKLGYVDCGSILFPGQIPAELVLLKQLRKAGEGVGPRQKA